MTALEKINQQEQRKAELDDLYRQKTETQRQVEQFSRELQETNLELQRFERDHQNEYRPFKPGDLDAYERAQHEKLKTKSDGLHEQLLSLQSRLKDFDQQIEAAQEAASATIEVKAEDVIAQKEIVEEARAQTAKISEAIENQRSLMTETLELIEKNQTQIDTIHQDDLAKQALGEIDSVEAVEGVTRMADSDFDKSRASVEVVESTIAGLTRRLEQAQHALQTEEERLESLVVAYLEADFQRCRALYEKAAAKAVEALRLAWGFNRLLKRRGIEAGVNMKGGFNLPTFRGSDRAPWTDNHLDQDHAEGLAVERLRKAGIFG